MTEDFAVLYEQERDIFVQDVSQLSELQWAQPSLRPGWAVRDVVAHLLMPFELGVAALLGRMVAARFNFDRLALQWAVNDGRTPNELLHVLAATKAKAFNVPGAGPLAPLSHLTIHALDIRGPLGIDTPISPAAARPVLDDITGGRHAVSAALLAELRLEATDAEWGFGHGRSVKGPAGALMSAMSGRAAAVDQLVGNGTSLLRSRLG
ncbi:maleylpyruvate isomerase family mycothiol-dependent enzyme [Arthrobacter sp. E3]|uniref:maleylpyruvate isomerase family mycothiol-dependent enzyme n=1 Tax=Arthrobacter sp. E3 TaxID=517402 RepID=UPI001A94A80E|nr:maleylpyruvate isomerase family mycothiol-dependent enzyme [Arthrobacter sp. E3]